MGEFFVYSFFFGIMGLLFPVFVYFDSYLDVKENKCWFSVSFYKYFRLIGGYIQLTKDGMAIHLTKKTAFLVPYNQMADTRKKFEITKGFQLYSFRQVVETGDVRLPRTVLLAAAIQAISAQAFSVLKTRHPFLSLKNSTLLTDETTVKLSTQTSAVFNGLVLIVAISKKILEGILKWIREKKLTASWKRRRNSLRTSST